MQYVEKRAKSQSGFLIRIEEIPYSKEQFIFAVEEVIRTRVGPGPADYKTFTVEKEIIGRISELPLSASEEVSDFCLRIFRILKSFYDLFHETFMEC